MFLVIYKRIIKINYGVKRIKIYTITDITGSSDFSKNLTMFQLSYVSVLQGGNHLLLYWSGYKIKRRENLKSEKPIYEKENWKWIQVFLLILSVLCVVVWLCVVFGNCLIALLHGSVHLVSVRASHETAHGPASDSAPTYSVGRRLALKGVLGCNLPFLYCFCVGFTLRVNNTRVADRLYLYG